MSVVSGRRVAAIILLFAVAGAVWSQEPAEEQLLFGATIAQDIATARFHELVNWLEVLGLSTRGDRAALVARLAEHYGVPSDEIERARPVPDAGDPPLIVDSASRTSYFTLEQIDERYVRLSGGVVLVLRDEDRGSVHRIHADEIIFNEQLRMLAASGSVRYVLEREGTVEQFSGEALTVELDEWEGAFVRGVTERERMIDGEAIDFRFGGTYITRSRDDVIVLEEGTITSSQADPPNYHISAQKIWVLAPGEWGLRHAFLHVGRVPVMYMPFFFRPGNELFFNPSVGTRDRAGGYIQTTTYLVGAPEQRTSSFSFLQLADDQGPQSEREIRGLFLVPVEGPEGEPPPADTTVRLLADVYTRLGAYAGLTGNWPQIGPLQRVRLSLGLAVTRHIYLTGDRGVGGFYTPYYVTDEGETRQSWNTSELGRITLPLRYGIDFSARAIADRLTANLRFESYSDRRFRADFEDRGESIDWFGLLGQGESPATPPATGSLVWQIDASYNANVSGLERVSRLALQRGVLALNWRSKLIDADELPEDVRLAHDSPQAAFFYPVSMRLPELSGVVSGTLLTYPGRRTPSAPTAAREPSQILVPPWGDEREPAEDAPEAGPPLTIPPIQPALPTPRPVDPFSARIGYSLAPVLIVDQTFLDQDWNQPSDVDFGIAHGGASLRMTGSVTHATGISSDLVRADGSLATTSQYRTVFRRNPELPDATWESLERQAWNFTSFTASHNLTVRALPLRGTRLWSGSSLAYTVNLLLAQVLLDEVIDGAPTWKTETLEWEEQFFRQHQVQATAALGLANPQTLQVTAALPPRDERYSGTLALRFPPVSASASTGVRRQDGEEADDEWIYDPLAVSATFQPVTNVSMTNALSYDIENEWLSFNRTSLRAGPLTAEYEMRRSPGFTFGGPGIGWRADDDPQLRPASARAAVVVATDLDPLWRSRVLADLGATLNWNANLLRFTEGSLRFTFRGSLVVHRFLRVSLESTSVNSQSYVYVRRLAEAVGREPRNLLVDLARSFNFFNRDDRVRSGFDLQSIRLSAFHDLGDWDLTVGYSGRPELETAPDGIRTYRWRGVVDLSLKWRPIRELSSSVRIDEDMITFGSNS